MEIQFPDNVGTPLNIKPMSFQPECQLVASKQAAEMGLGVRMELHNAHTEFYATPDVEVGKIDVWAARSYSGMLEFAETIEAGTPWDPFEWRKSVKTDD